MSRAVDDSKHLTESEIDALASRLGIAPAELLDRADASDIPALVHLASCATCRAFVEPDTLSMARLVVAFDEVRSRAHSFPQSAVEDADLQRLTKNGMRRLGRPRRRSVWPTVATLALAAGVGFVVVTRPDASSSRRGNADSTLRTPPTSAGSATPRVEPAQGSSGAGASRAGDPPSVESDTRNPSQQTDRSRGASSSTIRIDRAPSEEEVREILTSYQVALSGKDTTGLNFARGLSPASLRRLLGNRAGSVTFELDPSSVKIAVNERVEARVRVGWSDSSGPAERDYLFLLRLQPGGKWSLDTVRSAVSGTSRE